jgi:hypothetical protein
MGYRNWTPEDVMRMTVIATVCLCLLLLVVGALYGVLFGGLSVDLLGTISKGGLAGCGLLGLGLVLWFFARTAIPLRTEQKGRKK